MSLKGFLSGVVLLLAGFFGCNAMSAEARVVEISDLRVEAKLSEAKGVPILLMIAADHCPYCSLVEDDVIKPMIISGDYVNKVLIRKLDLDTQGDVIDFDGVKIDSSDLANRYDIDVTPTVLFLDGSGRQVAKRMVGVSTIDYYGYYLDEAIERALGKLQKAE